MTTFKEESLPSKIVTVGLVIFLTFVIFERFAPKRAATPPPIDVSSFKTPADPTLVVVTSSKCKFCTESMPFYQELWKMAKNEGIPIINVASGDTEVVNAEYFKTHGIELSTLPLLAETTPFRGLPTPTLLVLSEGKEVARQTGKFASQQEEKKFMTTLFKFKRAKGA